MKAIVRVAVDLPESAIRQLPFELRLTRAASAWLLALYETSEEITTRRAVRP